MMMCGAAVGMLLEGVGGLQARLASQAPLLVEPGFSPQGVRFQPEGPHMLKVPTLTQSLTHSLTHSRTHSCAPSPTPLPH